MRAAVLRELGMPLVLLENIDIPALAEGQVLVEIAYSGVCHSQVMEARGKRGEDRWLPHMLGHEATGRVVAIGGAVTKVKINDLVILGWIKGTGLECGGCSYNRDGEVINAGGITTFSQFAVVSENRVSLLPDGIPLDVGVLFGCAVPTGAGIVLNELNPKPDTTLAIFGVGGIGICALLAALTFPFSKVIAIDVVGSKLDLAVKLGARHSINAADPGVDVISEIRLLTGVGVDYAIDASGHTTVIEQAFQSTHPKHGLTVFASHPPHGEKISLDPHALISGRQIRGSWGGGFAPERDIQRVADLYLSGGLPLDALISDRYQLEDINAALDDLEAGKVLRPLIEVNPNV